MTKAKIVKQIIINPYKSEELKFGIINDVSKRTMS